MEDKQKEELINFLKDNLFLDIEETYESDYGRGTTTHHIKLVLAGEVISSQQISTIERYD